MVVLGVKEEIRSLMAREDITTVEVVKRLNEKYGREDTSQNLSNKMSKGTLRYREAQEIADVMGYDIVWIKRKA